MPKDFVPKDPKLLLPKDFQPNKEFHPKIGHEDEEEDDDHGDGDEGDDDVDHPNSFPSMPGSLPRTNVGHGKNHNNYGYRTVVIVTTRTSILYVRSNNAGRIKIIFNKFVFN